MKVQILDKTVSPFTDISFVNDTLNIVGINQVIDSEHGNLVKIFCFQYSSFYEIQRMYLWLDVIALKIYLPILAVI